MILSMIMNMKSRIRKMKLSHTPKGVPLVKKNMNVINLSVVMKQFPMICAMTMLQ